MLNPGSNIQLPTCTCVLVLLLGCSFVGADLWRLSTLKTQGFGWGSRARPPLVVWALMWLSLHVVTSLRPGEVNVIAGTDSSGSALWVTGRCTVGRLLLCNGGSVGRRQGDEDGGHHPLGWRHWCHGHLPVWMSATPQNLTTIIETERFKNYISGQLRHSKFFKFLMILAVTKK